MTQIVTLIARFVLGYLKSLVLLWVVLPTIAVLLFIVIGLDIPTRMPFMSFLLPTGTFDGKDVMKFFGVVSLLFYILTELLKLAGLVIKKSFWRGVIILSIIFGIMITLVLFPTESLQMTGEKSESITVILLFFFIAQIAYAFWYLLSKIKFYTASSLPSKQISDF